MPWCFPEYSLPVGKTVRTEHVLSLVYTGTIPDQRRHHELIYTAHRCGRPNGISDAPFVSAVVRRPEVGMFLRRRPPSKGDSRPPRGRSSRLGVGWRATGKNVDRNFRYVLIFVRLPAHPIRIIPLDVSSRNGSRRTRLRLLVTVWRV